MSFFKPLLVLPLLAALTGCISSDSLIPEKKDSSFYLVDTKNGLLCLGLTKECVRLSIVASQNGFVGPIERAYGQKLEAPNYPRSLMNILLKPSDGSYKATAMDNSNRLYSLPKNDKTDTAWRTMNDLYRYIYE